MMDTKDIEGIAAEYVLGTLDGSERAETASLRPSTPRLDEAIVAWEKRMSPLSQLTPEAVPSEDLYPKIERQIFLEPKRKITLNQKISFWRSMALAASLACVIMSGVAFYVMSTFGTPQYIAVLQKDATTPTLLVRLNEKTATLMVEAFATTPPPNKSYELWLIPDGAKSPRSLGVLPASGSKAVSLGGIDPAVARQATLAVSVEPLGGSPTGLPTGPVILAAKFLEVSL